MITTTTTTMMVTTMTIPMEMMNLSTRIPTHQTTTVGISEYSPDVVSDPELSDTPETPITPSAVEVDYNFDDVTDRCDKEACPPVNCASPYIPLGECCPVCPPQEVVYEERRGSTSAQGRPGAPGPDGRPGAPGPPGPQPDLGPFMGQIEQQAGEKGPSPDPFSYMQAQVGPVGPRGSPGEI